MAVPEQIVVNQSLPQQILINVSGSPQIAVNSGQSQPVIVNAGPVTIIDSNYVLPVATSSTLGGVKIGANLAIDGNGVLSANTPNVSGYVPILPNTTWTGNSTFSGSILQPAANGTLTQIAYGLTGGTPTSAFLQYQTALDASGNPSRIARVVAGGLSACLSATNYTNGTACATSSVQSSVSAVNLSFNDGTGNSTRLQLTGTAITFTQLTGNTTYSALSLLTQSYADGRYLTPSNAAASYYPLTGNPSGFLASATAATTYVPKACGTSYFAVYDGDIIVGTTKATAELQDNYIQIQKALVGDVSHPPLGGSSGINIGENWLGNSTRPYVSLMGSIDYYYWADDSVLCRKYADSRYLLTSNYTPYTLPAATNSTLGGVIVGSNLTIANGVLSAVASGGLDSNSTIDGGTY